VTAAKAGRCPAVRPLVFGQRLQVLDDLLVQFGAHQDRQEVRCPLRGAIVTPVAAGVAVAHVGCHGQPQVSGQHQAVRLDALRHPPVTLGVKKQLPQFPAPEILAVHRGQGSRGGREGSDLESAQHGLAVLTAQPLSLGDAGAQFERGIPAVHGALHEQVVQLLPGFWQRGHDLLEPVLQRCLPCNGVPHVRRIRQAASDAGLQHSPVDGVDPGTQSGRELAMRGDAKQPVPQAVRPRQLRGVIHLQISDDEDAAGRGDRGVGIRPVQFGAPAEHRVAVLVDHVIERRRAIPFRDSLPEAPG
jgi:hypothetical protein